MSEQFSRTELLLGEAAMERLSRARVAVFGIGGVGGYVCEALVRSGIGAFDLVDNDTVCLSNLNRQIIATRQTIGRYKTEVMKERMLAINPDVDVRLHNCFFLPQEADQFPFSEYDYIVDAVDTVTAKIALVMQAQEKGVPIISSMGAGNKLDGSLFRVADLYQTKVCPLAKVMRRELKKRGIKKLKVVYSEEQPVLPCGGAGGRAGSGSAGSMEDSGGRAGSGSAGSMEDSGGSRPVENSVRRAAPGSVAFVPSVAGLLLAGEVVKDIAGCYTG